MVVSLNVNPASAFTVRTIVGVGGTFSLFFVMAKTVAFSANVLDSSITAPSALVSLHSFISLFVARVIKASADFLMSFHVRLRFFLTLISLN